jgi:hypothetical protein
MSGKHIELFLVDGVPGGITTAEIAGWTGHVLSGPRSDIADVLARSEAQRNGAYFLLGDDAEALGGARCYVGRSGSMLSTTRARNFASSPRRKYQTSRRSLLISISCCPCLVSTPSASVRSQPPHQFPRLPLLRSFTCAT